MWVIEECVGEANAKQPKRHLWLNGFMFCFWNNPRILGSFSSNLDSLWLDFFCLMNQKRPNGVKLNQKTAVSSRRIVA